MNFAVITLFPEMFENLRSGLTQTALDKGIYSLEISNLREYGKGVHKAVDDEPYGGGDGMLMQGEPLLQALESLKSQAKFKDARVINLSPKGKVWNQNQAQSWVNEARPCIFVCGRYAGIDQRFIDNFCDEEVSIGDYVLNGGELGTLVIMDSMTRLLQGTLGNPESSIQDSFSANHLLEHPQYTRPQTWNNQSVPSTLLSGNHEKIERWKANMSLLETALRRPELLRSEDKDRLKKLLVSKDLLDQECGRDFGLDKMNQIKSMIEKDL